MNNSAPKILDLSSRTTTWNNIGTDISTSKTLDEVIENAGLNYEVTKRKLLVAGAGVVIPDRLATFRKEDNHVFGVVSPKYEIIQNREAFDFVNYINGDIEYVKAGETGSGMVYIIGKLPDQYILDDKFTPYVIFRNSFNGRYPIQSTICPLRIICQNQFNLAFKSSDNTVVIKHSKSAEVKMQEAQEILRKTAEHMNTISNVAEKMATEKVSDAQVAQIVNGMFPVNEEEMSKRLVTNTEAEKMSFMTAYNAEDNQNFKGTKWGLMNAFSDFQTHKPILRSTSSAEEQRFVSVVFDPTAMLQFMSRLEEVA